MTPTPIPQPAMAPKQTQNAAQAPAHGWSGNRSPAQIASALRPAANAGPDGSVGVRILTHPKPDGDALGSTLALARSLAHAGIPSEVRYIGPLPAWAAQLSGATSAFAYAPGVPVGEQRPAALSSQSPSATSDSRPAMTAVLDTGSWSQLAEQTSWLKAEPARVLIVDHHVHGDADAAPARLIDTSAASATQVLAPVCCELLRVASPAELPLDVATPLYLGLATDTGWFKYSNVTPATLHLAADLLKAGVDHTWLYNMVEQRDSASRWKLLGRALATLSIVPLADGGSAAIITLSPQDFADTGATLNDTGGFADMLLHIDGVKAAGLLTEQPRGDSSPPTTTPLVKISMRSKPGAGSVDVNAICKRLGGGGHIHAAGGRIAASLADARLQLVNAIS